MPPPPPISKQGLWDPRSSEEQPGPRGFGGWYPVSLDTAVSAERLPPAADCGCCHPGSGEREGVTGQVGKTEAPPRHRDLSHRILSTLSAWLLLLCNKNRRFPGQRPGGAGLGLQPVTPCSISLGILVSESSPGLFCPVAACWDLRGPGGQPGKRPRGWASQQPPPQAGAGSDS